MLTHGCGKTRRQFTGPARASTFDGAASYAAKTGLAAAGALDRHGGLTVGGWLNSGDANNAITALFADSGTGAPVYNLTLNQAGGSRTFGFEYLNAGDQSRKRYVDGVLYDAATWYHVVFALSVGAVTTAWLNGTARSVALLGANDTITAAPVTSFALGRPGAFNGQYFSGYLQCCFVANQVLADADVTLLYGGGAVQRWADLPGALQAKMAGWWDLGDDPAGLAADSAGSNHLTQHSMGTPVTHS